MSAPLEPPVRVEVRLKNNRLHDAIYAKHESVAAFCRAYNLQQTQVSLLLCLRQSAYLPRAFDQGELRPRSLAVRLSAIFTMDVQDLFPPELYQQELPSVFTAAVPLAAVRRLRNGHDAIAVPPSQERELGDADTAALVRIAVSDRLTPRQAQVITRRFGLDGDGEQTLDEVAVGLGVTKERVRQIEAKALRKLRHPQVTRGYYGLERELRATR